ncbi:phosphoketolase family protein [Streptomyces aureus]
MPLGHWDTSPGLNLVRTHLDRVVKARDLDVQHRDNPRHSGG